MFQGKAKRSGKPIEAGEMGDAAAIPLLYGTKGNPLESRVKRREGRMFPPKKRDPPVNKILKGKSLWDSRLVINVE